MDEEERYKRVQERVKRIRGFYTNLITYILVNILLIIINLVTSPDELWFYWVTIIWGIILIIQAFNIFTLRNSFLGHEWEKKKIEELLEKERDRESKSK